MGPPIVQTDSTFPFQITSESEGLVVFTPSDFDRFVMSQRDVMKAAQQHVQIRRTEDDVRRAFGGFIADLEQWCKAHDIVLCLVSPRMDDVMVVVVASHEDEGGGLHDKMAEFDLANFQQNGLRLAWMMLRQSEASGVSAFVDLKQARVVFQRAQQP